MERDIWIIKKAQTMFVPIQFAYKNPLSHQDLQQVSIPLFSQRNIANT